MCGLRCIHTHPSGTPELSKADTTALEQNRFDVMACISVNPASTFSKKQGETVRFADSITTAFLIPEKDENGNNYRTLSVMTLRQAAADDFTAFLETIEQNFAQRAEAESANVKERAILVGLHTSDMPELLFKESLFELEQLADTAGAEVICTTTQSYS